MNILFFMEMSVPECILLGAISMIVCLCYSGIGSVFLKQYGIMIQSVCGMIFVAACIVFCAEFCAGLAKYVITASTVTGLLINLYRIKIKQISFYNQKASLICFAIMYGVFLVKIIQLLSVKDGVFYYNNHQTYFAGVPLEIVQADYFSRLRIMDVYPYEWSKYHFFNGSFTAIPLFFLFKYNYLTYLIAKFATVSLYLTGIFELIAGKIELRKAILNFVIAVSAFHMALYNGFRWSLFTNNYSSMFLFLIAWILFSQKEYMAALSMSIGFALTRGGAIVTGGCLFLYGLVMAFLEKKSKERGYSVIQFLKANYRTAVYSAVVGMGVFVTAFAGKESAYTSSDIISHSFQGVMNNVFSMGWLAIMPLGGFLSGSKIYLLRLEFFVIPLFLYLAIRNRKVLESYVSKHKVISTLLSSIVCLIIYNVNNYVTTDNDHVTISIFLFYLLPIFCTFIAIGKEEVVTYGVFLIGIFLTFILFNAGVSVPNYLSIVFLMCIVFAQNLVGDLYKSVIINKTKICLYAITSLGVIYSLTASYQEMYVSYSIGKPIIALEEVKKRAEPFEYNSEADADMAKLNALKGNRVHYNIRPDFHNEAMHNTSEAMSFLPKGFEDR